MWCCDKSYSFFFYSSETIAEEIEIPSVFTSYFASQNLRTRFIPEPGWVYFLTFGTKKPTANQKFYRLQIKITFWNCNILICLLLYRAYVILKPEFAFPLAYYLIPFTGVVGMIIIVMCVVLVRKNNTFYLAVL